MLILSLYEIISAFPGSEDGRICQGGGGGAGVGNFQNIRARLFKTNDFVS